MQNQSLVSFCRQQSQLPHCPRKESRGEEGSDRRGKETKSLKKENKEETEEERRVGRDKSKRSTEEKERRDKDRTGKCQVSDFLDIAEHRKGNWRYSMILFREKGSDIPNRPPGKLIRTLWTRLPRSEKARIIRRRGGRGVLVLRRSAELEYRAVKHQGMLRHRERKQRRRKPDDVLSRCHCHLGVSAIDWFSIPWCATLRFLQTRLCVT